MNSWLEEAEKRESLKIAKINNDNIINEKIITLNNDLIQDFINGLIGLIDRVNKIPQSTRQPNDEIGYYKLEDENKYEFFGSALFSKNRKYLLFNIGRIDYTIWRRIYFELTHKDNKVKVSINEKYFTTETVQTIKRYKDKYILSINKLDKNFQDRLIDWLVFRISNKEFAHNFPITRNIENEITS